MLRAAQEQAENSVASARAEAEKTRNASRAEAERSITDAHKQAETAVASAKAQAKQVLDEATARATAIHDGAERRLNLLMSRHTEAIRRLTEIRDVVTTLVAGEVARGSLEEEVEKAVASAIGDPRRRAGGPQDRRRAGTLPPGPRPAAPAAPSAPPRRRPRPAASGRRRSGRRRAVPARLAALRRSASRCPGAPSQARGPSADRQAGRGLRRGQRPGCCRGPAGSARLAGCRTAAPRAEGHTAPCRPPGRAQRGRAPRRGWPQAGRGARTPRPTSGSFRNDLTPVARTGCSQGPGPVDVPKGRSKRPSGTSTRRAPVALQRRRRTRYRRREGRAACRACAG